MTLTTRPDEPLTAVVVTPRRRSSVAAFLTARFGKAPERDRQLAEIDRLDMLDDAELAALGLRRGGVAGQVLGNRFCY